MKESQLVSYMLALGEAWDLLALCRLLVRYWHLIKRSSISLGILAQTPITLGGKTVLVDFMVIEDPLEFNILLGCDYVYAIQAVVSTFFRVMYFTHNYNIVTIDQLDFLDPSPDPTRE